MADRMNSSKAKQRSLSATKRKRGGKDSKGGSTATSPCITSFFNNTPPPRLACPLCGQLVPRFRMNEHIDLQCQNFQRENDNGSTAASSSAASNLALSPSRNANNKLSEQDTAASEKELKQETQTSPYFKKRGASRHVAQEMSSKTVVRTIDLGGLSSRLSRRGLKSPGSVDIQDSTEKGTSSEELSSSQKENHLPQGSHDKDTCLALDPTSAVEVEGTSGDCPSTEVKEEPEHGDSKSEAPPAVVSPAPPSPAPLSATSSAPPSSAPSSVPPSSAPSRLTKRKKREPPRGPAKTQTTSALSKKGKHEENSVDPSEALSNKLQMVTADNNRHTTEDCSAGPSDAPLKSSTEVSEKAHVRSSTATGGNEPTQSGADDTDEGGGSTESTEPPRLPYYLCNFLTVLGAVLEKEDDRMLFNQDDLSIIHTFERLSVTGQKLYVRLFQRKLKWLQVNKLDYAEISTDMSPVAEELVEGGFLQTESDLQELEAILDLLPAPELRGLAKTFHLGGPGTQKQQLVDELLRLSRQRSLFALAPGQNRGAAILKRAKQLCGSCVRVCRGPRAVFSRVLLLFSLADSLEEEETAASGQAKLYTILLVNSGRLAFPAYTEQRSAKLFLDREDLIRYEAAMRALQEVITAMQAGHWEEALGGYTSAKAAWQELRQTYDLSYQEELPVFLRCFSTGWAYTRVLSRGVEVLQRLRRYAEAVEELRSLLSQAVYCPDSRGRWWDRLALNLQQHLKQPEQAIGAISNGLSDPLVRTGHQLSLHQRAVRMKESPSYKKYRLLLSDLPTIHVKDATHVTIRGQLFPHEGGMGKNVFLMPAEGGESGDATVMCSVEELSLAHYRRQGFDQGIHGEGATFTTLFGLLLWDIIFMEGIPDAFRNPYQPYPLDLFTDCFYGNRREAIETRVQVVSEASAETLTSLLADTWTSQQDRVCALVNWELFSSLQQAQSLVSCLGGAFLAGMITRLAKDYRHCRAGLPDLVVWDTSNNHYKLVEVKGPTDRLSQKQQIWLGELQRLGADVEVCHVTAIGARGARLE